ncbi:MAG: AraC family transcriptional regulator [Acidobacteriota bacterium]
MPELKFFPETHVAFVSEIGSYNESIPRGFKRLFDWMLAHKVQPVGPSLAIFYDDPTKVASKNRRCDLCAPVGPRVNGSGEVRTKEIGGWTVATIEYQGESDVRRAYNEVYDWLHEQGYHEADAPVEKYLSALGEELRAEVAVPVIKKELMPTKKKIRKAGAIKPTKGRAKVSKRVAKKTARKRTLKR